VTDGAHVFGGPWTEQKLGILRGYLSAYTTALSKTKFKKGYIDAFAGTGQRESSANAKLEDSERLRRESGIQQTALPDFIDPTEAGGEPVQRFLDGSARVALQSVPAFDSYVFIEKSPTRCRELERLKSDFPHVAKRISVRPGDANAQIQVMCDKDWKRHRAVLFLDPYGTEVRWKTVEAIAKTKAIDLWVLFPLGGVHRMLTQSGEIPQEWRHCLDELLGTTDWYEHFYRIETSSSLFGERIDRAVKAGTEVISEYFLKRLRSCFAGVAPNPAVLRNSKNFPLYLFCFAAGNVKGAPIALQIASHILEMGS
jgi:hypothetical protein